MARVSVNLRYYLRQRIYHFNGTFDKTEVARSRWRQTHRHEKTVHRQKVTKLIQQIKGVEAVHLCISSVELHYDPKIINAILLSQLDHQVEEILQSVFNEPSLFKNIKRRNQLLEITISDT